MKRTKAEALFTAKSMSEYRRLDAQIPDDGSVVIMDKEQVEKINKEDFKDEK